MILYQIKEGHQDWVALWWTPERVTSLLSFILQSLEADLFPINTSFLYCTHTHTWSNYTACASDSNNWSDRHFKINLVRLQELMNSVVFENYRQAWQAFLSFIDRESTDFYWTAIHKRSKETNNSIHVCFDWLPWSIKGDNIRWWSSSSWHLQISSYEIEVSFKKELDYHSRRVFDSFCWIFCKHISWILVVMNSTKLLERMLPQKITWGHEMSNEYWILEGIAWGIRRKGSWSSSLFISLHECNLDQRVMWYIIIIRYKFHVPKKTKTRR